MSSKSPLDALKVTPSDPWETVRCLLAARAQLDDTSAVRLITKRFTHNWSRSLVQVIKAWKPNISTLYARGQSVSICAAASTDLINVKDDSGQIPLLDAVRYQSLGIVSRLLQGISTLNSSAPLSVMDPLGNVFEAHKTNLNLSDVLLAALETAIELNRPERAALLLEHRDVIRTAMRTSTLLFQAIGVGYPNIAKILINAGIFPDEKHISGYTPLLYAAEEGLVDIVQALINTGAVDVRAESWYQETALMLAVINNHPSVVQTLLTAGASTNRQIMPSRVKRKCYDPQNIPHHAYILSSTSRPGPSGDTLLLHAASRGYNEIVRLLIPYSDVNAIQEWSPLKQTALYVAVINGHTDVLRTMLDSGRVDDVLARLFVRKEAWVT
ncbi:ankyrin repeat domain-containing protein [Aspergillus stella-maris]|uniref:ankyrin repeat domain-containing protein n=1 Tax=Aspergillus stella-maris TaxID=1810926 RepID=UPI003CCD8E6D